MSEENVEDEKRLWRSVDSWPRRSSVLIAGVLLFVDYLFVALVIAGDIDPLGKIALATGAAILAGIAAAEVWFALRPAPERLALADRVAIVGVGAFFALAAIASVVLAIVE